MPGGELLNVKASFRAPLATHPLSFFECLALPEPGAEAEKERKPPHEPSVGSLLEYSRDPRTEEFYTCVTACYGPAKIGSSASGTVLLNVRATAASQAVPCGLRLALDAAVSVLNRYDIANSETLRDQRPTRFPS